WVEDEMAGGVGGAAADPLRAVDADDLGAHVGQQHARERPGADARHLDDPDAGQRPGRPGFDLGRPGFGRRHAQRPVQTGARLAANAVAPSTASALANTASIASAFSCHGSPPLQATSQSEPALAAWCSTRLVCWTESGALAAIRPASASARETTSAGGATSLTRPHRRAVAASTGSPVRASWAASLIGTCRCSRITPPAAANRPRLTSG